jgi:predicted DNA-binding protein (MmcQ/YjbR family)
VPPRALVRLRKLCLSLPESSEKLSWGAPNFRVRERVFAMYAAANNHHGDGRESVWLNCDAISQQFMIQDEPKRYFKPAYVGPYGWIGVYLDGRVNWKIVTDRVKEAHEFTLAKLAAKKAAAKARSKKPKTASKKK